MYSLLERCNEQDEENEREERGERGRKISENTISVTRHHCAVRNLNLWDFLFYGTNSIDFLRVVTSIKIQNLVSAKAKTSRSHYLESH
jgi:hypothetical protein